MGFRSICLHSVLVSTSSCSLTLVYSLTRRKSTLLFLRTWLRSQGEPMGRELLSSIRDFARSIGGSDTMREVAQEIADLASEKVCASDHNSLTCLV
jgi:hypothetical protein